ncbi:MAG TPA: glycosyltransferase [Mycobacteriales bacterium]|jgi:glycosyltransferase involved in cell wall biosynthesis|nr:glycosyltransferase [Mycobacteriales bacterium]
MATLGLVMIVKNEQETLPRLAASVIDHIDHYTILDTGSTDDTIAVAREVFGNIPGEVLQDEWRGFGPSRNVALDAAIPHTDWVLTLDADDVFEGARPDLDIDLDGLEAMYHYNQLAYTHLRVIRSTAGFRWVGRAHEYLTIPGRQPRLQLTNAFRVHHMADGGMRATKWEREIELLEADFADDPTSARTAFYIARSYDDAKRYQEAIDWYTRRLALDGWDQEDWYAAWRLGVMLLAADEPDEGCGVLWSAWNRRPWRAEPLVTLAEHYRLTSQWMLSWEACDLAFRRCGALPNPAPVEVHGRGDRLFVHVDVYEWRIAYEQSIAAYYAGEQARGRELTDYLLARTDLPENIRASVEDNAKFYPALGRVPR